MTTKVYLVGYGNLKSLDDLAALCKRHGAVVIDIRMVAKSRIPCWNKGNLQRAYDIPYAHAPELGNVNYKNGGDILIADFAAGVQRILAGQQPVILMCACKNARDCHRTVVGNMLRLDGFDVEEIGDTRIQRNLYGE